MQCYFISKRCIGAILHSKQSCRVQSIDMIKRAKHHNTFMVTIGPTKLNGGEPKTKYKFTDCQSFHCDIVSCVVFVCAPIRIHQSVAVVVFVDSFRLYHTSFVFVFHCVFFSCHLVVDIVVFFSFVFCLFFSVHLDVKCAC